MRGHIRKHGDGWQYVVYIGKDPITGKKKYKSKTFKRQSDCEKAMNKLIRELETGQFVDSKTMTLADYLDYWLETYAKVNVTDSTYKRYTEFTTNIKNHIGIAKLQDLKPAHIQQYYSKLVDEGTLSNSTILKIHRMLHLALKHAVGWQMIYNNPSDSVTPPKVVKTEMKVWDEDTAKNFLDFIKDEKIYLPVKIALETGMREGEISALKWENVDLINGVIYVTLNMQYLYGTLTLKEPKTKKSKRKIVLFKTTIEALKAQRKKQIENKLLLGELYNDNNFVCTHENGDPFIPQYISKRFQLCEKAYNKENNKAPIEIIRFHDLRHTHATWLLKKGINPKIVSERLGHANVSITLDTYSHVLPDIQKQAIESIEIMQ
jgi:integrase